MGKDIDSKRKKMNCILNHQSYNVHVTLKKINPINPILKKLSSQSIISISANKPNRQIICFMVMEKSNFLHKIITSISKTLQKKPSQPSPDQKELNLNTKNQQYHKNSNQLG